MVLGQIFWWIVSIRVMTLINTNVGASRHIRREEVSVAVRHSKTPEDNFTRGNENVTHSSPGETVFFLGGEGEFSV